MNLPHQLPPLPVTVVTGFLGAGKTTLINHILRGAPEHRIGVLVNDFGDVSIDADLIVAQTKDVLTLTNGCICCSLRGDLTRSIMTLAESTERPEHLLVEASGISYPETILAALIELERYQIIRLDGVLGVVDAVEDDELSKESAHLARSQKLAADILLVSKTDLLPKTKLDQQLERLRSSFPKVLPANYHELPVTLLLGLESSKEHTLNKLDIRVSQQPHLLASSHTHETMWKNYRLTTTAPLSFKKLVTELKQVPSGIFRAKGFLHIVERPGMRLLLHLTGRRVQIRTIGKWSTDPCTELVFIGLEKAFDIPALVEQFNRCIDPSASEGQTNGEPPEELSWVRG
ncbi:MAG: GTP-binding protein [Myxococcales bacterium]|nr:GTP-binding protein [Myxococcales bacterium]